LEEDLIDATNTPNTSAKVLKELKRAVKVTVEFPAPVHRDLLAYAEVFARETGQPIPGSAETGLAHAGAVHSDGPCVRKSAAQELNGR
jgi:hypothetical protein